MFSGGNHIKRIFAGLFLALFVFIQAEKNLHEHAQAESRDIQKGTVSIQKNSPCTICDFQLAADADIPANTDKAFFSLFNTGLSTAGIPDYSYSAHYFFPERGPPSLC